MKRKRHNPEQIIRKLRIAEQLLNQGQTVPDVCRALEVSAPTDLNGDLGSVAPEPAPFSRCLRMDGRKRVSRFGSKRMAFTGLSPSPASTCSRSPTRLDAVQPSA
jgi:hypothetical protein